MVEAAHGTRRIYSLHGEGIAAVEAYLAEVWGDAMARFRLLAENTAPPATTKRPPRRSRAKKPDPS